MSVSGLCQICESAEARFQCDRCGRMVCDSHYDREMGLCSDCAEDARRGRAGTDEARERDPDDHPDTGPTGPR